MRRYIVSSILVLMVITVFQGCGEEELKQDAPTHQVETNLSQAGDEVYDSEETEELIKSLLATSSQESVPYIRNSRSLTGEVTNEVKEVINRLKKVSTTNSKIDSYDAQIVKGIATQLGQSGKVKHRTSNSRDIYMVTRWLNYSKTKMEGVFFLKKYSFHNKSYNNFVMIFKINFDNNGNITDIPFVWGAFKNKLPSDIAHSQILRSADPLQKWKTYGNMNMYQLENGNASHMSPAEIIYYSYKENNINPVLVLSKLQQEQSLIERDPGSAIESRLFRATGMGAFDAFDGGDISKYYGFYPQVVSMTYQFDKYYNNNWSITTALGKYTTGAGKADEFKNQLYPKYAQVMNDIAGTNWSRYPSSNGYYHDFSHITLNNIQSFLNRFNGSLKNKNLFKEEPLDLHIFGSYYYKKD